LLSKTTIKRSDYLKKISWEHHQALRYALHIKKGVTNNTDGHIISAYVTTITQQHLEPHFTEEEQALFSRLSTTQKEHPALQQVLKEHQALPLLAETIAANDGNNKDQLLLFSHTIVQHIKLEEKTLFPFIEQALSKQALREAQAQIENMHQSGELDWPVEFWKKPATKPQ
jgi:hemerythrin-like domain-containing protein